MAEAGVTVGQILLGKYRTESVLGHGGMGVVAKCVHLGLNENVAIKMLRQDVMLDRDATERFTREAQAASKLKSEHVARVVDVGTFPDSGVPYMVMEFLDGHDLGDLVDERGPLQAPFAAMLMLQAAEALCEAHSIGIVHRDVKPSNLFVTWRPDGSALVKVLDFGISKSPMGTDLKLTQTQSLLGTPAYMSPEQMRSARLVDSRTDIWSLGTVFYELLEGRRPFEAESFSEMCVKVAVDPPAPMVNAPPALQQVILRCLAKNPDQRYANMAELGRDLLPYVQDVHQASLLVERMQRMLGRAARTSAANADPWEGLSTGVGRTPIAVLDAKSAPVQVPVFNPSADPLAVAMPTPPPFGNIDRTPDPRSPTATLREDSAPARALSEVFAIQQPPKRSKTKLLFIAAGIAIGIAAGVTFALMGNSDDNVAGAPATVDTTVDTTPPKPDVPAAKGSDVPVATGSAAPTDPPAAGSAAKDTPSATVQSDAVPGAKPSPSPNPNNVKPEDITLGSDDVTTPPKAPPKNNIVRPNRPPPQVRKLPPKDTVKPNRDGTKVGNQVMAPAGEGSGSAKTVAKPPEPQLPPGKRHCKIDERLPSKKWPSHCAQSVSK